MPIQPLMFAVWVAIMAIIYSNPEQSTERQATTTQDTTLVDSVSAGRYLIVQLPDELGGRRVRSYAPIRIPVMGQLHGQSFFWDVPADTAGDFRFEFSGTTRADSVYAVILQVHVTRGSS
jgi:hypothetical protein